jgi:DNA (cytosine-5)-methyltransferase 1
LNVRGLYEMRVLDLFSGIGGFSLGLERAGMRTVAFCEIDPFCRRVLAKHWPDVRCYGDVRTVTGAQLAADGIAADVICGGFPCQDISKAGKGAGIDGERSGLWREFCRLVGELRPSFVIVENVATLLGRGLGRILGDLAEIGFDAEWHSISAADIGAPHVRSRIWIVAYPIGQRLARQHGQGQSARDTGGSHNDSPWPVVSAVDAKNWLPEPALGRMAHGIAHWLVRSQLSTLGNAVVPQIPEIIGRAIMSTYRSSNTVVEMEG